MIVCLRVCVCALLACLHTLNMHAACLLKCKCASPHVRRCARLLVCVLALLHDCIFACAHVYACMVACFRVHVSCTHACVLSVVLARTRACADVCMCTRLRAFTRACLHVYTVACLLHCRLRVCARACVHTCMLACRLRVCIHACVHACMLA